MASKRKHILANLTLILNEKLPNKKGEIFTNGTVKLERSLFFKKNYKTPQRALILEQSYLDLLITAKDVIDEAIRISSENIYTLKEKGGSDAN